MDGKILGPEQAMAHLAAWKGRLDKMAAETQAMSRRLQDLRVTATDRDGLAEVTVDSAGSITGLRLTERMVRAEPDAVARAIMSAATEARNRMATRSEDVITETVGTESAAGRAIADSVRGQLVRDRDGSAEPASRRPGIDDDDGEEYDIRSDIRR